MKLKLPMRLRGRLAVPTQHVRNLRRTSLLLLLAFPLHPMLAQTDFTRILGPVDRDVKVPTATGVFGHVDAAASTELIDHVKAVGASPWHDMSGTGKITYQLGESAEVDDAALTILNADSYRLDIKRNQGNRSIRILGASGVTTEDDGSKQFLLPGTAAQGLFAFPQLRVATFPGNLTSIYDKGMLAVDGNTLHRLSVEHPLSNAPAASKSANSKSGPVGVVTDLYFDPVSHLLIKSVASIKLSGLRSEFIQCVTYDDYRQVGTSLVPFRFEQSLNGQVQWTLQLDEVELNTGLKQANFYF
jgi:hypothetical protein